MWPIETAYSTAPLSTFWNGTPASGNVEFVLCVFENGVREDKFERLLMNMCLK